jgi:hypothetical protein
MASTNADTGPFPSPVIVWLDPPATTCAVREVWPFWAEVVATLTKRSGVSGSRYSNWKISHSRLALTSPPPASVCACTAFENSICSRRGRSRLCSDFMM